MKRPTITAVIAAYQTEAWIEEAIDSVLAQTHPADEIVVVDDGSTDGTAALLERYAGRGVRVIRQDNAGCPAAHNTAIRHAHGDFIALCGSDDIWEPEKLAEQVATLVAHPEVDVLFSDATLFGLIDGRHAQPPGVGLLDGDTLREALYRENSVCAPSVVIRRSLFGELGPFVEDFGADDYEYWMRCLRAGARFYYDPRPLLRYRQRGSNLSARRFWMLQCCNEVRVRYAGDVADRALVDEILATDSFKLGRLLVDDGRPREARDAFRRSLRHHRGASASANARAAAWLGLLSLPDGLRARAGELLVRASRTLDDARGGRSAVLP